MESGRICGKVGKNLVQELIKGSGKRFSISP
jgi:hypothetical protein